MYAHETSEPSTDPEGRRPRTITASVFAQDPGTCPKCLAPIEPERLPEAELCLDCIVVR